MICTLSANQLRELRASYQESELWAPISQDQQQVFKVEQQITAHFLLCLWLRRRHPYLSCQRR